MQQASVIILAAGQGTRMPGDVPKVLFDLAGEPMLKHVIAEIQNIDAGSIHIVIGYKGEQVKAAFPDTSLRWHEQDKQQGTAHAVACALPELSDDETVLITYGDMPLLRAATYQKLLAGLQEAQLVLLTTQLPDPTGYGRILRDDNGQLTGIIEQADATPEQCLLDEVNVGVMAAKAGLLRELIDAINTDNQQGEYYLTDCLGLAVKKGIATAAVQVDDITEARGVNKPPEIEEAERLMQRRRAKELGQKAFLKDAARIDIRGEVSVGDGVLFDVGVVLEGRVAIGNNVQIGPYVVMKDVTIADDSVIKPFSHLEDARIGRNCRIGPHARIRPATSIDDNVHIGNFVETKKSRIKEGSKINHLSYIGDSEVGKNVNIGAGTITCNYDGTNKHNTVIGDDVFIGSDTQIIAPVTIGTGATIGAGSTIVRDAEAGKLTLSRSEQKTVKGWKRPKKD